MRIGIRGAWLLLLIVFLFSCADPIPVPQDKINYIGIWIASDRYISIFANGRLEYRKKLGFGMHNRTASNFTFVGDTLDTGMFGSFVIDTPPYKDGDHWKMQMEGDLYVRTGPPKSYGKSSNWPDGIE